MIGFRISNTESRTDDRLILRDNLFFRASEELPFEGFDQIFLDEVLQTEEYNRVPTGPARASGPVRENLFRLPVVLNNVADLVKVYQINWIHSASYVA